jgi:hypothetical protein
VEVVFDMENISPLSDDIKAVGIIPLFFRARPTLRSIMLHYWEQGHATSSKLWERDMVSNQWSQIQEGTDIGTLWDRSLADVLKSS